jgi:hypothetical protein
VSFYRLNQPGKNQPNSQGLRVGLVPGRRAFLIFVSYATGVEQKLRPDTCSGFADRKSDCVLRGVTNVTNLNCNITSNQTYRTVVMRVMRCMF